jgi:hypothetical protein
MSQYPHGPHNCGRSGKLGCVECDPAARVGFILGAIIFLVVGTWAFKIIGPQWLLGLFMLLDILFGLMLCAPVVAFFMRRNDRLKKIVSQDAP